MSVCGLMAAALVTSEVLVFGERGQVLFQSKAVSQCVGRLSQPCPSQKLPVVWMEA